MAEGCPRPCSEFHALSFGAPADARRQQRLPPFFAPGHDRDSNRVGAWLLLQHRTSGEVSPSRLADRRSASPLVRACARLQPVSGEQMAAGLPALVCLRIRHKLPPPTGGNRSPPACGLIGATAMSSPKIITRRTTRVSPWVEIIERGVELNAGGTPELYHAVAQRDYVAI